MDWRGPYKPSDIAAGNFDHAKGSGCYAWYLPLGTKQQPYYVGQTTQKLHGRLCHHFSLQLGGDYACFDTKKLKDGIQWCDAVVYQWKSDEDFQSFLAKWDELGRRAYETLLVSTFYVAHLNPELCNPAEAVLIKRYKDRGYSLSNTQSPIPVPMELICTGAPQVCKDLGL